MTAAASQGFVVFTIDTNSRSISLVVATQEETVVTTWSTPAGPTRTDDQPARDGCRGTDVAAGLYNRGRRRNNTKRQAVLEDPPCAWDQTNELPGELGSRSFTRRASAAERRHPGVAGQPRSNDYFISNPAPIGEGLTLALAGAGNRLGYLPNTTLAKPIWWVKRI